MTAPPFPELARNFGVLAAAMLLSACAALPSNMAGPHALLDAGSAANANADAAWPQRNAWDDWADPVLTGLVADATARQPALLQVQSRLAQAQAAADGAGAASKPQVNLAVDLSDQRFTANGLVPPPLAGNVYWNNSATLSASWEWDLFGRQKATLASAIGTVRAATAEVQAARVLLAANVAAGYVTLARAVESRDIAQAALEQRRQVLALVQQRISAGLDTTVELRQGEGTVAQAQVELGAADEQIERARHGLAELSGQRPDALGTLAPHLAAVVARPLPEGLPADLLGRRADLVAQRWRVEAATQDVAVARAQFYPNINLVGFAGLSSIGLDTFLKSGSATYGIGPALRLPVFDGGRLRANLGARAAEVDVAVEGYNAALLRALREVADEVSSLRAIERQQVAQTQALQAAEAAFDVSRQRYQAGLGNFLVVLTAEANVLAQRRGNTDLKARHLTAEVALGRALGGGWRDTAPGPAVAVTSSATAAATVASRDISESLKATP